MNDIYKPAASVPSSPPGSAARYGLHPDRMRFNSVPMAAEDALKLLDNLNERRQEVLGLAALGLYNQEIGTELSVTESTVKSHMCRIHERLGVKDRVASRSIACAGGLLLRATETDELPHTKEVILKNGLRDSEVGIMSAFELTINDLKLLTLTSQGLTLGEAAKVFGIEGSSLKSRADVLYKRLGVKGKKQAQQKVGILPDSTGK